MLAPAADREEVDNALASLIDISSSPQYGCHMLHRDAFGLGETCSKT